MSSQEEGVKGLVEPDLSKVQNENEFLFFRFSLNFFQFFSKIMAYVEYPEYPVSNLTTDRKKVI